MAQSALDTYAGKQLSKLPQMSKNTGVKKQTTA